MTRRVRIIGPGRAGRSMATALRSRGWTCVGIVGRSEPVDAAAEGVDLLVVATPDWSVASVAEAVEPVADTLVVHLAGSLGLDVLATHVRRGSLHPLASLPSEEVGAARLLDRAWFAVDGGTTSDRSMIESIVSDLGGRSFTVADADRARYHAAACIAANHLVALMGQVERISMTLGVPPEAFTALAQGALDGVAASGAQGALTGPVSRGDWSTVAGHLAALDPIERPAYAAMAESAWFLHHGHDGSEPPSWLTDARKGMS